MTDSVVRYIYTYYWQRPLVNVNENFAMCPLLLCRSDDSIDKILDRRKSTFRLHLTIGTFVHVGFLADINVRQ